VDGFCGWPFLVELVEAAPNAFMQGLMAAMFETGGRISEVLSLSTWMVDPSLCDKVLVIKQMPLLKRFKKVGDVTKWKCVGHCKKRWNERPTPQEFEEHRIKEYVGWVTEPIKDQRTFPIRMDEPLTPYFKEWWEKRMKTKEKLLFPIKRSAAFVRIRNVGRKLDRDIPECNIRSPLIYDHWFRSERACQLHSEYGFLEDALKEFFGWKERKISGPEWYARLGWKGLARRMGVQL